ncbi:hypothetical protein [Stutzerimonas stutzeri]|uniref:hypothetical protein n=1 Tax=Stutzerimonas stutzeri TaxID=316 RepID=UPI000302879E|nr:hypothetical protein [Stutzerimonas stutzeri]
MKIGYAMLYPYRGSIQNMIFLSELFKRQGHQNFFLKCNASVPYCYNRMIKGTSKLVECTKCFAGGVDTFNVENVTSIDNRLRLKLSEELKFDIVSSSSYSLHRIETDEDCSSKAVLDTQDKLKPLAEIVYANALKWIEDNELKLVFIFNGRLDMPRAVLKACESKGIPFITFEAAYPGVALEVNDDCRSLKSLHKIIGEFIGKPLKLSQAVFSAEIANQMLSKSNLVWRLYNTDPLPASWPSNGRQKILIVPSSNHELKGADAWTPAWKHPLEGVEAVLSKLNIDFSNCVIRSHPNWSENIGVSLDGSKSERVYVDWATRNGAVIIPSSSKINTIDLIRQADIVIVQYGTAGIEAGLLGKKVIGLSPSWYSTSGFSSQVHSPHDFGALSFLETHDADDVIRRSLRFIYCFHKRCAQYVNFIRPLNTYENEYNLDADVSSILNAVRDNFFTADDPEYAEELGDENLVIDKFRSQDLDWFGENKDHGFSTAFKKIERRVYFRWIDKVRPIFKAGDR